MLSKGFKKIVKDIKSLKIQGASNVRKAASEALLKEFDSFNDSSSVHFKADLMNSIKELVQARPTEPELRTALRIALHIAHSKSESVGEMREELKQRLGFFEKNRSEALRKIAVYGARLVPEDSTVLTHCHSHTVLEILKEAHRQGKIKHAICTETRPLFQGRMTAQELSKAGIKTTMIVDSGAASFAKECSVFITGADAVLSDGSVVNKVGTYGISMICERFGVPHFVACGSAKFDPITFFGFQEVIEERSPQEVWGEKLKNLEIKNPAFDITPAKYIRSIITEKGVFPATEFAGMMFSELKLQQSEQDYLSLIRLMKNEHR